MADLLGADGFQAALVAALVAAAALALVGRHIPKVVVVGLPAIVGALAGFVAEHRWSWPLVVALLVLAVGGEVGAHRQLAVSLGVMVPGAVVLAAALPQVVPDWGAPVAVVAVTIGATLVVRFDATAPRWSVPLLLLTAGGIYGAVPDTEYARALVGGVLGACALALMPRVRGRAGAAAALAGLWAWSSIAGGYARPASVVGALGCLGVLVIVPSIGLVAERRTPWPAGARALLALFALQGFVVLVCSRIAGLRSTTWTALAIVVLTWAIAAGALRLAAWTREGSP